MPSLETLETFVSKVETKRHDLVIAEYYTEDASIQENQKDPRAGRAVLVAHEQAMLKNAKRVNSKCLRPYFVNGDEVVIRWRFEFLWKDGTRTLIEEMVHQTWEENKIKKEQFYYDPKQFNPVKG